MGDLIGPNPTNVGGPKSNGGKYENFVFQTDSQTDGLTDGLTDGQTSKIYE